MISCWLETIKLTKEEWWLKVISEVKTMVHGYERWLLLSVNYRQLSSLTQSIDGAINQLYSLGTINQIQCWRHPTLKRSYSFRRAGPCQKFYHKIKLIHANTNSLTDFNIKISIIGCRLVSIPPGWLCKCWHSIRHLQFEYRSRVGDEKLWGVWLV